MEEMHKVRSSGGVQGHEAPPGLHAPTLDACPSLDGGPLWGPHSSLQACQAASIRSQLWLLSLGHRTVGYPPHVYPGGPEA